MAEIWTIGHWTYPESEFVALLEAQRIDLVADVRAQPGSRRNPQFSQQAMSGWLSPVGIDYVHLTDLAGRRRKQDVDPEINAGWQNASFKNYADYTLAAAYVRGISHLVDLATGHRVVVMCGEPMPWRCHRLLIANTLTARDWTVRHIMGDDEPRVHELGCWGAAPTIGADRSVSYPG